MMKHLLFILVFIFSCNQKPKDILTININSSDVIYTQNSQLSLSCEFNEVNIDNINIKYYLNDKEIKENILLSNSKLGTNTIKAQLKVDDFILTSKKNIDIYSDTNPVIFKYKILNEYSHDISSYTQGLEFFNDFLYESTGLNGYSAIKKIDLFNGKVVVEKYLDDKYFGEGLTIINDHVLQLTWKNKIGFIYDPNSLNLIDSFNYDKNTEGWGLANDSKFLYLSDGSSKIRIIDPKTFLEIDSIEIVTNTKKIKNINELEVVDNIIYANTYQSNKDVVLMIEKNSGKVLGLINFDGLRDKVKKHPELDVLNGIAFNEKRNSFFVTGKKWDKIFEVKIFKE